MDPATNRTKVYAVLVLCIGIVTSIWLFQRKPQEVSTLKQTGKIEVSPIRNFEENTSDDWKKILVSVDPKNQTVKNLTKTNDSIFNETTLTAQISKDFLSQYLLLKQGGKSLTENEMNQIVVNLLETKNYTEVKGPVYIISNLKITGNDSITKKIYKDNVTLIIKTRSSQATEDPILLINQSMGPKGTAALEKIDFTIGVGRGTISDFLKIEVPSQAAQVHLELLNTVSSLVADIEAMRELSSDPVRSLVGMSQYSLHFTLLQNAIKKMNLYLASN